MTGVDLIAAERQRQIDAEGWTPEHDDEHEDGDLALAAATYAIPHEGRQATVWMTNAAGTQLTRRIVAQLTWPNSWMNDWKPTPDNRIRELAKAGALIAAEIDRIQRASDATS